jgi:hypothetical protein
MLATVSITLTDGTVMEGAVELRPRGGATVSSPRVSKVRLMAAAGESSPVDFNLPMRPFIKRYAKGPGPKKLTWLIAKIAGGDTTVPVRRADVERNWGKMTSLMGGGYNGAYDTRARDCGWIHSPKSGVFELLPTWREIAG